MQIDLLLSLTKFEQFTFCVASSEIFVLLIVLLVIFRSDNDTFDYEVDVLRILLLKTSVEVHLTFIIETVRIVRPFLQFKLFGLAGTAEKELLLLLRVAVE